MEVLKVNPPSWSRPEVAERGDQATRRDLEMPETPRGAPAAVDVHDLRRALEESLEKLNAVLENSDVRVGFYVHEETGRLVVQVVNRETGEVVKEIPPKRVLETMAKIKEFVGLLLDEKV